MDGEFCPLRADSALANRCSIDGCMHQGSGSETRTAAFMLTRLESPTAQCHAVVPHQAIPR